ncbi:MAG: hypothetical protein PHW75_00230 [Patescibacteria group bacterium]|nr:hypothetical protein [Patescibacteria group bacterium]
MPYKYRPLYVEDGELIEIGPSAFYDTALRTGEIIGQGTGGLYDNAGDPLFFLEEESNEGVTLIPIGSA